MRRLWGWGVLLCWRSWASHTDVHGFAMNPKRFSRLWFAAIAMLTFASMATVAVAWQAKTVQSLHANQLAKDLQKKGDHATVLQ